MAFNVLFLCTGNSARSIMAEAILDRLGGDMFNAFSAGSMPKGQIHPMSIQVLERLSHKTEGLRSKSWEEFSGPDAPKLDFVVTVCDNAANEVCPIWPGHPISAHWGLPDPAAVEGNDAEIAAAFNETYQMLTNRIKMFTALPTNELDKLILKERLDSIGKQ